MHTRTAQLIYYFYCVTSICWLFILWTVTPDLLVIAHGKGHSRFAYCHKIISRSWYIWGLTKILRSFIYYCPYCLTLQIRKHILHSFLQLIYSLPVPFFTFMLNFILILSLTTDRYNILMSVTYKFSKKITLIKGKDTWIAKKWAHAFLARLDLVD